LHARDPEIPEIQPLPLKNSQSIRRGRRKMTNRVVGVQNEVLECIPETPGDSMSMMSRSLQVRQEWCVLARRVTAAWTKAQDGWGWEHQPRPRTGESWWR
jgi:hypothetical protein